MHVHRYFQSDWSTTYYQSNGDVLEMQTEVVTDDAISSLPCRGTNSKLQSLSENQSDLSLPAPQYSDIGSPETSAKEVLANQEKVSSEPFSQVSASSPQESLTSATLSSFPLTTESQLPEVYNSQEHIGNEIFDVDTTCVASPIDTTKETASTNTAVLLHVDYDNLAMQDSNNDLTADENKVLLTQVKSRQKPTTSITKTKHNKRAPPPPEYKVVMKHSGRFHVHGTAR